MTKVKQNLPYPPKYLMQSVGTTDIRSYDNPSGDLVFGDQVPVENYISIFDFGCGCGRVARQLLLQNTPPERYVGIDLFKDSIDWASQNLTPLNKTFKFYHHDVYNVQFNPHATTAIANFPVKETFKLVNAHSVFTHILEDHLDYYLRECVSVMDSDGIFRSTWFLFDKHGFPMMQEFQNCLYVNIADPTNACIYDYKYVQNKFIQYGLVIYKILAPAIRGHQWILLAKKYSPQITKAEFPVDVAQIGIARPPIVMNRDGDLSE